MDYKADFNVFVGTKLGIFKGIKLEIKDGQWQGITKAFRNVNTLSREEEITTLEWGDENQKDILIGYADRFLRVFESDFGGFSSSMDIKVGEGKICGLGRYNGCLVAAVESGHVCVRSAEKESVMEVKFRLREREDYQLEKMRLDPINANIFAVGGKNTDLQMWDLEKEALVFKAKNVRHNFLDLEVPVWISDLKFIPNSNNIATTSRYGHVRIYDPRGDQRRPVFNFELKERALTACDVTSSGNHIVFGSGTGHMGAVDVRSSLLSHSFKGAVGGVRGLAVHPSEPYVFSVGLDRFLRVHHFEKRSLLYKEFMKARCNSVLVRDDFFYQPTPKDDVDSDIEIIDIVEEEEPKFSESKKYDRLFDQMEAIVEEPLQKKRKKNRIM